MPPALAGLIGAATALAVVLLVVLVRKGLAVREQLNAPRPGSFVGDDVADIVAAVPTYGMVVAGSHDEVLAANEAALRLGLVRGTRLGFKQLLDGVREVRDSGQKRQGSIDREREPGTELIPITGQIVPLADGAVLVVAEDASASRRADEASRDFLANISHELKTPIGAIAILADTLEAAADDPDAVARFTRRLQTETARLAELVGQIIDLSRLQSADPLTAREVVDVEEVIDEALSRCHEAANARSVALIRTRAPGSRVMGDKWQLCDAVTNLIRNAIAYSDERARVAVTVAQVPDNDDRFIDIKVADNGIGIKPEDVDRVFERFYRVDYGRSRDHGGTGLGLSIVRHIAHAHGGSVTLWSKPNQGSTFTLRIPAYLGPVPRATATIEDEE